MPLPRRYRSHTNTLICHRYSASRLLSSTIKLIYIHSCVAPSLKNPPVFSRNSITTRRLQERWILDRPEQPPKLLPARIQDYASHKTEMPGKKCGEHHSGRQRRQADPTGKLHTSGQLCPGDRYRLPARKNNGCFDGRMVDAPWCWSSLPEQVKHRLTAEEMNNKATSGSAHLTSVVIIRICPTGGLPHGIQGIGDDHRLFTRVS